MNRWFWILMIYVRRPLNWALAAVVAIGLCFLSQFASVGYVNGVRGIQSDTVASFFSPRLQIKSQRDLMAALESPSATPVAVDLGLLAADFQFGKLQMKDDGAGYVSMNSKEEAEARLADAQLPENILWLTTSSLLCQQATINQIGNIESIKQLELLLLDDTQGTLDLSPLARLHNLERLALGHLTKADSLSSLSQLKNLKTLIIGNHQFVTRDNLSAIALFQSLQELYLPDISRNPIAMEAVKQLDVSNTLDRLYVAVPTTDQETLSTIAATVSDMDVRPSKYLPMQGYVFIGVLWGTLVLSSIGSLVEAQFTLPAAQLAPAYQSTHGQFTSAICIGLIATGAFLLWSYDVHPCLAVLIAATALLGSLAIGVTPQVVGSAPTLAQRFQWLFLIAALSAAVEWVLLAPLHAQDVFANPPWLLLVTLMLATGCFASKLIRCLKTACRDRIEAGNAPILSMHDLQQRSQKLLLRSSDGLDPYQRITKYCSIAGCVLLLILVWEFAFAGQTSWVFSKLPFVIVIFVIWSFMAIGTKSWRKIPYQASMMIRPPGRRVQVNKMFIDVATDFGWTIPIVMAAALMASHGVSKVTGAPAASMIAMTMLAFGVLAMVYAATMWALTVRSLRHAAFGGISAFFTLTTIVATAGAMMDRYEGGSIEAATLLIAWGAAGGLLVGIAALATFFVWQRYLKLEWGHYLR